uniref:Eukaryotic translation initiation factor 2 subunit 2 n=1 Tax=Ciona savignyi TaxID=51511 RepID=H2ZQS4_CIOSA
MSVKEDLDFTKKKKVTLDLGEEDTTTTKEAKPVVEESDELDLSKLKKRKKKKTAFVLADSENVPLKEPETNTNADEPEEELVLTKKKKSKSKILNLDNEENGDTNELEELELTGKKKKKHKVLPDDPDKKVSFVDQEDLDISMEAIDGQADVAVKTWSGSDRDYTYDELLTRVFDIMRQKNPEMVAGEKKRFIMKPPQCARVGTKKTSFLNFSEICQTLRRQPKHILAFILAELGTSGSVDGNNQLIIKGRFQQKQLESVLRRYIREYVTCHTCRSPDTILERDVRLYFLRCNVCQSRCSVAAIKSGFQAVTGKQCPYSRQGYVLMLVPLL